MIPINYRKGKIDASPECIAISNYKDKIDLFTESRKYTVEYLTVNKKKSQINLDFKNVVANGNQSLCSQMMLLLVCCQIL
jgi:hypothetical protein